MTWEEVERAEARSSGATLRFGPAEVLARVAERGDLFAAVAGLAAGAEPGARP